MQSAFSCSKNEEVTRFTVTFTAGLLCHLLVSEALNPAGLRLFYIYCV